MMSWSFFFIYLAYPADWFLHYWPPGKSLHNSGFVCIVALKSCRDQSTAFKYLIIFDIIFRRLLLAFCWKMSWDLKGLGLTVYHSGFQNTVSVTFDKSLTGSFTSLHMFNWVVLWLRHFYKHSRNIAGISKDCALTELRFQRGKSKYMHE